jgi:hypothetical protein
LRLPECRRIWRGRRDFLVAEGLTTDHNNVLDNVVPGLLWQASARHEELKWDLY